MPHQPRDGRVTRCCCEGGREDGRRGAAAVRRPQDGCGAACRSIGCRVAEGGILADEAARRWRVHHRGCSRRTTAAPLQWARLRSGRDGVATAPFSRTKPRDGGEDKAAGRLRGRCRGRVSGAAAEMLPRTPPREGRKAVDHPLGRPVGEDSRPPLSKRPQDRRG